MRGADIIAGTLANNGVRQVFGVPGETILGIVESLDKVGVEFVSTRHEQAAVTMADGFARVSGRLGVAMVHAGPGVANSFLGVGAAYKDSSPILLISGNQEQWKLGRDAWHEIDQVAMLSHVTRWNGRAKDPAELARLLRHAITVATNGWRGPVHLDVPIDVWHREVSDDLAAAEAPPIRSRIEPPTGAVQEALARLMSAARPVIFAGGGVLAAGAASSLVDFADALGVPVVTTPNGRGAIAEDHPLAAGTSGQFGIQTGSRALRESDLIVAIGNRFSDISTDLWTAIAPATSIIQVDVDPGQIGRQFPVALGIVADAGAFLSEAVVEARARRAEAKSAWRERAETLSKQAEEDRDRFLTGKTVEVPVQPQDVVKTIERVVPRDAICTIGAGVHAQWIAKKRVFGPATNLKSNGFGAMGFSYPAALGAKLAAPDHAVLSLVGDGDFAMTMQEVETAVRYRIPVIAVIFNDMSYGIIRDGQERRFGGRIVGTRLGNPRYDEFARSTGAGGERIEALSDLAPAIERALAAGRPYVLDVIIDPEERPRHSLYD